MKLNVKLILLLLFIVQAMGYNFQNGILEITRPNEDIKINLKIVKTIKCINLLPMERFFINNIAFLVVDNNLIKKYKYKYICPSNVTNMEKLYSKSKVINIPLINKWDVSNVINMKAMFAFTEHFNQPLNNWDVSNVTDMSYMFYEAKNFNQPLNNWDISNVANMDIMFYKAKNLKQPFLKNWKKLNIKKIILSIRNLIEIRHGEWIINDNLGISDGYTPQGYPQRLDTASPNSVVKNLFIGTPTLPLLKNPIKYCLDSYCWVKYKKDDIDNNISYYAYKFNKENNITLEYNGSNGTFECNNDGSIKKRECKLIINYKK